MKNYPLVTIGIPVYNGERFIKKAIDSVLNQTYTNFELIITDDGSLDDTVNIVKSYDDPRIILVINRENRGISSQLNQQISLGKGVFFCRMDADDLMFPDRLQKQVVFLLSHPNIDAIGSSAIIIDNKNQIIGLRKATKPHAKKGVLKAGFIHPTVMGKMEWFKTYWYSTVLNGVEDHDLWLRSINCSSLDIYPDPLLFYRDPLSFKFSTYSFRLSQLKRLYKLRLSEDNNKLSYIKLSIKIEAKRIIALLCTTLKMNKRIIAQRNTPIPNSSDLKKYLTILYELSSSSTKSE